MLERGSLPGAVKPFGSVPKQGKAWAREQANALRPTMQLPSMDSFRNLCLRPVRRRLTKKSSVRHCALMKLRWIALACMIGQAFSPHSAAATSQASEMRWKEVLAIRVGARPGRSVVQVDPIEEQIVTGEWRAPHAGEVLSSDTNNEHHWEAATANEEGVLKGSLARGGYVYWPVVSDHEQIMLLEAAGHNCVYVNGELRAGDPYGYGYLHLPVLLHAGTNDFLFQSGRGDLRAKLMPAPEALSINTADCTLPDIIIGEREPLWGAAVLVNATTNLMRASLRALEGGGPPKLVTIPPLGICKAPFLVHPPRSTSTNHYPVTLEAIARSGGKAVPVRADIDLRVRRPDQCYRRTFLSEMDDSVQYYAVNPASSSSAVTGNAPALFLSLHGAGVEALGQAEAYSPKRWGPIVCPTNRRPYGFDWEEWGRWDALEVLSQAKARYRPDPARIFLTGHSMGGHGTWQLGALFPDQFAAIGPSAGWISFSTYANPNRAPATNDVQQMLRRAAAASDTLLMATNYLQEGVYILHGDADDNVPVREAREMHKVLGEFHHDLEYHEQPGVGHWWDVSDEPGADCVDWAPMFDFFAHHAIPTDESLRRVQFVTVNPAVTARSHWVTIMAQQRALEPSAVDLRCDPVRRRVVGSTTNVSRLWLEFPSIDPGPGLTIDLDGQKLAGLVVPKLAEGKGPATSHAHVPGLCLVREAGTWRVGDWPASHLKRPERSGPFREAFRNHMVFVYGTQGTPAENAWTRAKARYDAETFYYRGNASIELMSDLEALAQEKAAKHDAPGRNFIVYGHAECNAAWAELLGDSPVQVHRGRLVMGSRTWVGQDLGCLFVHPNPRDPKALVGVVAGSGISGMRVTERLPYFLSGAGFPDCLVIDKDLPALGAKGVRAAGFFGPDWQIETGEFAWGEK
jgi:dienelactone hydrolase